MVSIAGKTVKECVELSVDRLQADAESIVDMQLLLCGRRYATQGSDYRVGNAGVPVVYAYRRACARALLDCAHPASFEYVGGGRRCMGGNKGEL